jgi:NitT/TauT family transport system ATP-binding protein
MSAPLLVVDALGHEYDGAAPAIDQISLTIERGEFVAVVGPSGSGKSTLLRAVAGLLRPSRGEIRLDGRPVTEVPDRLAMVFQDYGRSLFPWMTVRDNVDLPLRHLRLAAPEREKRIGDALGEVGLNDVAGRHPWQLSGGMQQRVAIARAIAYRPALMLMDEPFGSVDAQTRAELQDMTLEVWRRHGSTVVFVTHDIDESVYLADRVIVLSRPPARIEAEIGVDLPRPRDQVETRASADYVERRAEVARLIRRPVRPRAG